MTRSLFLLLFALAAPLASAQIGTATALLDSLAATAAIADPGDREAALDTLWAELTAQGGVPFAAGDSAVFLWRGSAGAAQVAGDHTGWSPVSARRFGSVWARAERFDPAARVDYKWVVDGSWILDPENPHQQWGGFGPNSELQMPAWVFPTETIPTPGTPVGTLSGPRTLASPRYGRTVTYRVWTPADIGDRTDLPVVYVTDGHEYADTRLGALPVVLDNLVAEDRIEAPVVVFIDPRIGGQNLRSEQYVQNEGFAAFVALELVPVIDAAYPTRAGREARVILGTSLGGLFSAYLGVQHPDVFGRLAIQSPAFWVSESGSWTGPSIYDLVAASPATFSVAMTTGTIRDTEDGARRMRDVIAARADVLAYGEVPEGHSWGNWRATLDELLEALLPPPGPVATRPDPARPAFTMSAFPNPASRSLTLRTEDPATRFVCTDPLGRIVWTAVGRQTVVPSDRLATGVYRCTATAGPRRATRAVTVLR